MGKRTLPLPVKAPHSRRPSASLTDIAAQDLVLPADKLLPLPRDRGLPGWQPLPPSPLLRYKLVWRRALFKIKAQLAIRKINQETLLYGTKPDFIDLNHHYKPNIDKLLTIKSNFQDSAHQLSSILTGGQRRSCLLFYQNDRFLQVWNVVLLGMMLYTAVVVPYRVAFEENRFWDGWTVMDAVLDFTFCLDICVNFCSVIEQTSGFLVTSRKQIALSYIKSWFFLDLSASFPSTVLDYAVNTENASTSTKYNSLIRLIRLPRVYKLIRVFRMVKVIKSLAENKLFERLNDAYLWNSRTF